MFKTSCGIFGIFSLYPIYKFNSKEKINIVLDMDETLLFAYKKEKFHQIRKSNIYGKPIESEKYIIFERPFLKSFLYLTSKFANLHLMTRGKKSYADPILKSLKIEDYFVQKKYGEDITMNCKDMKMLFNDVGLSKSILIDDLSFNQCTNQNFYHIPKYTMFNKGDWELVKLFFYLIFR